MSRPSLFLLTTGLLFALPLGHLLAADSAQPSAAEAKLRESLRATMLQLRTSENDKAVLQAQQAESDEKIKTLTAQVEAITKQMAADKDAADKAVAAMQAKLDERDKIIAGVRDELAKWKDEAKRLNDLANAREAQRAKLEDQVNQLNSRVADQLTKNEGMFKIANEILARYEKFGLGDALSAREPFTGITRVKLQSLFEEYQDKLVDQKLKPVAAKAPEPTASPTPAKTGKTKATPKPRS